MHFSIFPDNHCPKHQGRTLALPRAGVLEGMSQATWDRENWMSPYPNSFGREDLLIRVASQLEQAAPWSGFKPPRFS